jgi:hypothetical protein
MKCGIVFLPWTPHSDGLWKRKAVNGQPPRTFPSITFRTTRVRENWPQTVSPTLKDKISQLFRLETSSHALQNATCACCAESCPVSNCEWLAAGSIDLNLFRSSDFTIPCPFTTGVLKNTLLDPLGIHQVE